MNPRCHGEGLSHWKDFVESRVLKYSHASETYRFSFVGILQSGVTSIQVVGRKKKIVFTGKDDSNIMLKYYHLWS